MSKPIAVIGAGSWGTALAIQLARSGASVRLWDYDSDQVLLMAQDRCNAKYLPAIKLPDGIEYCTALEDAVRLARDILVVVPSFAFSDTLKKLAPYFTSNMRLIWATKGIDPTSNWLLGDIAKHYLPNTSLAVLSGPTFAKEVAKGLPTAMVVATEDRVFAHDIVDRFNHGAFRVYMASDMTGVQLGGAIKNVMAVAVGISDGLNYGANARAALITRGLAEMIRLGEALGALRETFMGLSGVGDLVLTCTDNQSRNRRFGLAIGEGKRAESVAREIGQVVEGVHTVKQVLYLAKQYHVEMPICEQVDRILNGTIEVKSAVEALLSRQPKSEHE